MEYDVERASLGLGLSSMVQPTLVTEEDAVYQNGYAGFASFLSQNYYQNFRRFKYLRMRILLRKQRKISCLEKQLQALDDFDTRYHPEWMISEQSDLNKQRDEIFESLEAAFSAYDSFLKKTEWILAAPQSSPDIINQTKEAILDYIIPDERHYLSRELDCFYVGGHEDSKIGKLLTVAENLVNLCLMLTDSVRKLSGLPSRPDRFYRSIIAVRLARAITAVLSIMMLLLPMIILNFVDSSGWRLAVVSIFAALFISALTALSAAGTTEIFVVGATYCAVLVVFVSQGGADGGSGL